MSQCTDRLEEVFSFLEQNGKTASSIIVDGDRVELHGLRSSEVHETNWDELAKKKPGFDRRMMFLHSGIQPKHRVKDIG